MINILHVDDENCENAILRHNLQNLSSEIKIFWVGSAEKALSELEKGEYECIVSDYQMPGMDGMQFLQNIRREGSRIPFVFLTGQGSEQLAAEALRAGADDYYTKDLGFAHYQRLLHSIESHTDHYKDEIEKDQLRTKTLDQEKNWKLMLKNSTSGIALHKIITDENGKPVDYIFLEVNQEYEKQTGLKKEDILNRSVTQVLPGIEKSEFDWIGVYGKVALTGESISFEQYSEILDKWYQISAYSPEKGYFVVSLQNISERKTAEKELNRSEGRFRRLLENAPDMIYRMSIPEGRYEYVSPASEEICGFTPEQILGNPQFFRDCLHPDWHGYYKEEWKKLIIGEIPSFYQYQIIHGKTGQVRWLNQRNVLVTDNTGKPRAIEGIVTDVTDRVENSTVLQESEARFRAVFDSAVASIFIWDPELRINYINEAAAENFNLSQKEAKGQYLWEALADIPEFVKKWQPRIKNVFSSGEQRQFHDCDSINDQEIFTESTLTPIPGTDNEEIISVCSIHRDVSLFIKTEEKLKEKSFELTERNKELSCLYAVSRLIQEPEISLEEIFQGTAEVIPGSMQYPEITSARIVSENREYTSQNFEESEIALSKTFHHTNIEIFYNKNKPLEFQGPFLQEELELLEEIGDSLDQAVEKERSREALLSSQYELSTIYENAPVIMMLVDKNRNIVKLNKQALEMSNLKVEEAIGKRSGQMLRCIYYDDFQKDCELSPECFNCGIRNAVLKTWDSGESIYRHETSFLRKLGNAQETVSVLISTERLILPREEFVLVCLEDITERKQIEKDAITAKEFAESLLETANTLVITLDREARITLFNRFAEKITGYNKAEVIGKNWFQQFIPVSDQDSIPKVFSEVIGSMPEASQHENPILTKGGKTLQISWSNTILKDETGSINGILSIGMDISEREKTKKELEITNEELARANKALEAFSHTVAHDLKAPLRHIDGFATILKTKLQDSSLEEDVNFLDKIISATDKASRKIDDILRFSVSSRGELNINKVDISLLARNILSSLEIQNPGRKVELQIEEDMFVAADEALITVALENLFSNAWKFTQNEKVTKIKFASQKKRNKRIFYIQDNGVGFDNQFKEKLFTPFQRLHSRNEFEGTGIGLATVQRVIGRHGGSLWAESKPGKGATFYFTLES